MRTNRLKEELARVTEERDVLLAEKERMGRLFGESEGARRADVSLLKGELARAESDLENARNRLSSLRERKRILEEEVFAIRMISYLFPREGESWTVTERRVRVAELNDRQEDCPRGSRERDDIVAELREHDDFTMFRHAWAVYWDVGGE